MKIVFLDKKTLGDDINLDQFKRFGEVETYDITPSEQTIQNIADAQIVVTNKVVINKEVMDNTNIKLICIAATGMNNVDLEYAKEKNIIVKNVSGYSTHSVTQITFAMVFHLIQQLAYYDDFGKNKWCHSPIFTHLEKPFFDLYGKNWGIIGLGEIGQSVAKVAISFGCNVSYYSTSGKNNNSIYEQKSLEQLLQTCDIVSIHAPLNDTTLNLINNTNIPLMKKDAILLNLGRGGIVNEEDIANSIADNQEVFYCTDVASKEPIETTSPLLKIKDSPRILITPHIAWGSIQARMKLLDGIEKNIEDFVI